MRSICLSILMCIPFLGLHAQFHEYFNEITALTCPFDSDTELFWPTDWMVYHTLDDAWNGPVDSTWCISVEMIVTPPHTEMFIDLEQIDTTRPLFLKYIGSDLPLALDSHHVYSSDVSFEMEQAILNVNAEDPSSSAVILVVDIPDADGTGRTERIHELAFRDSIGEIWSNACIPSEKFESQALRDVVLKLSFSQNATSGYAMSLHSMNISPLGFESRIDRHTVPPQYWQDTAYYAPIGALSSDGPWNGAYLLEHRSPGYPSAQNIHYHEVMPEQFSDTAQTLVFQITDFESFVPEPFTSLRGALVEGMEPERHRVVLENDGGDMCIFVIELQFDDGTTYSHKAGRIDFGSDQSCMMFKDGSTFKMAEGASLDYGDNGTGFLATKEGSRVVLRDKAHLTINNTWVLQSTAGETQNPAVYLHDGSLLSFSENGMLTTWGDNLELDAYMLGGAIEDDLLPPESRALINKIYPPARAQYMQSEALEIRQNRTSKVAYVTLPETTRNRQEIIVSDMTGRIIHSDHVSATDDEWQWHYRGMPSGMYLVSLLGSEVYTGLVPVD